MSISVKLLLIQTLTTENHLPQPPNCWREIDTDPGSTSWPGSKPESSADQAQDSLGSLPALISSPDSGIFKDSYLNYGLPNCLHLLPQKFFQTFSLKKKQKKHFFKNKFIKV